MLFRSGRDQIQSVIYGFLPGWICFALIIQPNLTNSCFLLPKRKYSCFLFSIRGPSLPIALANPCVDANLSMPSLTNAPNWANNADDSYNWQSNNRSSSLPANWAQLISVADSSTLAANIAGSWRRAAKAQMNKRRVLDDRGFIFLYWEFVVAATDRKSVV